MASRRRAREFALQALYTSDLAELPLRRALADLWASQLDGGVTSRPAESQEIEFSQDICAGVEARSAEVDQLIEGASANWRLPRMPVVDRNILRLATWEILASPEVPVSVSINEAVELAKRYGESDSSKFVNGILDKIAKTAC